MSTVPPPPPPPPRGRDSHPDLPSELGQPAGAVSRAIALIIDLVISTIAASATIYGLQALGIIFDVPTDVIDDAIDYVALASLIFIGYCAVSWSVFGQTVGKLLFGLRVVRPDGKNPHLLRSIVRVLAYGLSSIFYIGFAMVLFTRDRRGLHDYIAGTYVVYTWPARPKAMISLTTLEPLVPDTRTRRP